jgi:hypothetical protein
MVSKLVVEDEKFGVVELGGTVPSKKATPFVGRGVAYSESAPSN